MHKKDRESVEKSNDRIKGLINRFIDRLGYEYQLSKKDVMELLIKIEYELVRKEVLIPITIYYNKELSALETSCKYLKEELNLSHHQIAELLNRDDRTIWTTYDNAKEKREKKVIVKPTKIFVPASVFKDRRLSVLESLVKYLKEEFKLRYSEIAVLLNRDERNIWTVYNRAKNKRKSNS